jgi:cell division initiation protein
MNITSKDIRKRDFKKTLRGYDANEVDAFLDTISSNFEKLVIENKNYQDRIKALESDVEVYRENEQTLQKAIVKSQDLADEIVSNAKKKAELMNKEAELNIKSYKQNLEQEIINKKNELEEIKHRNERLVEEVRSFIEEKLTDFEDFFKSHKIYKMELTSDFKFDDTERDEDDVEIGEVQSTIKLSGDAVKSVNNNEDQTKPFDDNFEAK